MDMSLIPPEFRQYLTPPARWGAPVEIERRRRIRVAVWAYAYEFENRNLVPDSVFDVESYMIDRSVGTGHAVLDAFFRSEQFSPCTGQWIHRHPELSGIRRTYEQHYTDRNR